MTINSLNPSQSTPFTGLGTQTYNVPADGFYTVQATVTIPWMTSDAAAFVASAKNVQTITTRADSTGDLNDTVYTFYAAGNVKGWYVWHNINSAGTDPEIEGLTGIEVAAATDVTANTLATAERAAITTATAGYMTVTGSTSAVILTNVAYGGCTEAADSVDDPTGFTFAVGTTGTYGSGSGLIVKVLLEGDEVLVLSQPTPSQPSLSGQITVEADAGDVIEVVLSSVATADQQLNAVKGVINVFGGVTP